MRFRRPQVASVPLSIATAAYLVLLTNFSFWRRGLAVFAGHEVQFAALVLAIFLLMAAVLTAVSVKYLIKPVLIFVVMVAAVSSYFADTFGTLITADMIQNAAETTPAEAGHLITAQFLLHVALFGVVPSLLIAWIRVRHRGWWSKVAHNSALIAPCIVGAVAIAALNYAAYISAFREHRELLSSVNPVAPIVNAIKYANGALGEAKVTVRPLGTDAKLGSRIAKAGKPVLTVIVVGETGRAKNFSLDGYGRDTNPELEARDIVNFTKATSCGTATAVSVPCMFSVYPRKSYSEYKARSTENLMDVLAHAGIKLDWWDNNTGSKGVADRIPYEFLPDTQDKRFCRGGECEDGILVDRLRNGLAAINDNTVLVLHTIGSHGPTYFERYPAEFEVFKPACHSAQFANCKPEEIVNAYDNTIRYTDHVLAEIIDLLKAHGDEFDSTMIYMSDHGESLGEDGLYLHGAPYFLAPSEQTHVPFVAWLSEGYLKAMGLNRSCLRSDVDTPTSHDDLFHTVLGLMDVETSVYDATLDVFSACRKASLPQTASIKGGSRP